MSEQRLQQLTQMLEQSPADAFLQYALAKEYEKLDQSDEALQAYRKLLKEHPDYVGAYYHLGKLYLKTEDYDQAMDTYDEGIIRATRAGEPHARGELMTARADLVELLAERSEE